MHLLTIIHNDKTDFIPIIYEFIGKVKQHIFICDNNNQDKQVAKELENAICNIYEKYNLSVHIEVIIVDEDSKSDMKNIIHMLEKADSSFYLNGAGGDTALFTILASIILSKDGNVIAYDKEDNNYNLITKNGFSNIPIKNCMNIENFLLLMDDELLEEIDTNQIIVMENDLKYLFADFKRMFNIRYFLKIGQKDKLFKNDPKLPDILKRLKIIDKNHNLNGQEGLTKFGYLFESFLYLQLREFDYDDIKVGAKIRFDSYTVQTRKIEIVNEFDILLIKDNKIGFIECKLGDSFEALPTVYKSDSIMEYFGDHARSLIVNIERDKTPHHKNSKRGFGESVLFRAATKNVTVYNGFDFSKNIFRKKVHTAFGLSLKENCKVLNDSKPENGRHTP